ncbi:MAG: ParB/RepB/Spo0J family partition protein [Planctomycetaceae bacterium]
MSKLTGNRLAKISACAEESMGLRGLDIDLAVNAMVDTALKKEAGRQPLWIFGKVDLNLIVPDPSQPRSEFSETEIRQLAGSLQSHGQLHPIRVRWDKITERWVIISGERRYRAAMIAGWKQIDCCFEESEFMPAGILERQLVENLLRADLRPVEEARAFELLMKWNHWNGKQLAAALHLTESRVSRALALLSLPGEVQRKIDQGDLAKSSAYELTRLPDAEDHHKLADQTVRSQITHRGLRRLVNQRRGKPTRSARSLTQTFYAENGLRITVSSGKLNSYHEILAALQQAVEEVQLRIENNVRLR